MATIDEAGAQAKFAIGQAMNGGCELYRTVTRPAVGEIATPVAERIWQKVIKPIATKCHISRTDGLELSPD